LSSAARIEKAIFLDELERIALPVGAIGLDDVDVRQQQQRFEFRVAAGQHRDEVAILRTIGRGDEVQLLVRISGCTQARFHRIRGVCAGTR
jgi:hypothetical protein